MKKILTLLLTLVLIVSCVPMTVGAEEEDFIPVYTVEDLYNIRNNMSANYKLMNDIDLTEATAPGGDYDYLGNGWDPIGSEGIYSNTAFSGIFDGNGCKIVGLRIAVEQNRFPNGTGTLFFGLFARNIGTIKNISLVNSALDYNLNLGRANKRLLAGMVCASNEGTIDNCHAIVSININGFNDTKYATGSDFIGAITGETSGTINMCSTHGDIIAVNTAAADYNRESSNFYCGGIAGNGNKGTISYCFNNCSITSNPTAGHSNGSYYWYICSSYCGGICTKYGGVDQLSIINCYNTGSITSISQGYNYSYAAGICYGSYTNISNCYSIGSITAGTAKGIGNATVSNSYYLRGCGDTQAGSVELSDTQMLLQSMYAGFDFDNTWVMDIYANYPYPQLRDNPQDISPRVDSIMLIALPDKLDYQTGEALDPFGGLIEVLYASGNSDIFDITEDMITGYDPATPGVQTLTVTYGNRTETFDITVNAAPEIVGVELASLPAKTQYIIGSTLELDGAELTVTYDNGETETIPVTEDMVDGTSLTRLGTHTVTVTYEGFTVTFDVTVISNTVQSLTITRLPDKRLYEEGEALDTTGLEVTAVYTDGRERVATSGFTVTGYDSTPGTKTLIVRYLGKTATFTVTVLEHEEIHEHVWDDGVVTQSPTYSEEGIMTYTCILCGETRTEPIPVVIPDIKGDLTGDGAIGMKDLSLLKKALAGAAVLTDTQMNKADVNRDGLFNVLDLKALKELLAG